GGVLGLICDLGYIEDSSIARAISHKRRPAMSTVIVKDTGVIYDFRKRGMYSGPLNFLPVSELLHSPIESPDSEGLLPTIPNGPHPGFLGYAVDLVRLRPEYEPLRLTVLYAVFKDLSVFETCVEAEEARHRSGCEHLFYCALDFGPGDVLERERGWPIAHISHWGFR
ncbi:unnamed protein product, partial [Choristocarpus tenellus]